MTTVTATITLPANDARWPTIFSLLAGADEQATAKPVAKPAAKAAKVKLVETEPVTDAESQLDFEIVKASAQETIKAVGLPVVRGILKKLKAPKLSALDPKHYAAAMTAFAAARDEGV